MDTSPEDAPSPISVADMMFALDNADDLSAIAGNVEIALINIDAMAAKSVNSLKAPTMPLTLEFLTLMRTKNNDARKVARKLLVSAGNRVAQTMTANNDFNREFSERLQSLANIATNKQDLRFFSNNNEALGKAAKLIQSNVLYGDYNSSVDNIQLRDVMDKYSTAVENALLDIRKIYTSQGIFLQKADSLHVAVLIYNTLFPAQRVIVGVTFDDSMFGNREGPKDDAATVAQLRASLQPLMKERIWGMQLPYPPSQR